MTMDDEERKQVFKSSTSVPKCIAVIYVCMLSGVYGGPEFDLKEKLLSGYDIYSRPVKNHSEPITITIDMSLQHISDLDERNQILRTSIWMRWYWTDEYLTWDPSNHSGIASLHMSSTTIWTPDIALYNNVKAEEADWPETHRASVTSNGSVSWGFPYIGETSCRIDVNEFPYDTQVCFFKLGSWGHNGYEIDVQNKSTSGDITAFVDNGVWLLEQLPVKRSVKYYSCCPEPYPDITFYATLKRRSLFYIINLILPCIVFTIINLFTFLLPVESGDKISLNVTILLALDVFMLIVAESMPEQSDGVPDIGKYFIACNWIIGMSIISNIFVIHLYYRGSRGQNVPNWVRRFIIFGLGRVLCYSNTLHGRGRYTSQSTQAEKCASCGRGKAVTMLNIKNISKIESSIAHNGSTSVLSRIEPAPSQEDIPDKTARAIPSYHPDTSNREDCKHDIMDPVLEWQNVSLVMDRLFFVILTIVTLAFTARSLARIR